MVGVIPDRMAAAYELVDRRKRGVKSRWRYMVLALLREQGQGQRGDEILAFFRTRNDAADFTRRCAAYGEAHAYSRHADQMSPMSSIHRRAVGADNPADDQPAEA